MTGKYLLIPWIGADPKLVLLDGDRIEMGRLVAIWSQDGGDARYVNPIPPDPLFVDTICDTARALITERLADLAPVLTARAREFPNETLYLFEVCYAIGIDDEGRESWGSRIRLTSEVESIFNERLLQLAYEVRAATLADAAAGIMSILTDDLPSRMWWERPATEKHKHI